jgi:hypothetical protein
MSFEDKTLVCSECGSKFVFTAGEQEFYKQKGFENEPKRCQACRTRRKKEKREARQQRTFSSPHRKGGFSKRG